MLREINIIYCNSRNIWQMALHAHIFYIAVVHVGGFAAYARFTLYLVALVALLART